MDTQQDIALPNSADRDALKALVPTLVEACPDMYEMALNISRDILAKHGLSHLEPEQVYFHRFHSAQSSPLTFTGWEHRVEVPRESMTLPQLVIQRFRVHDQDNADLLDSDAGFYTAGPDAGNYDQTNEVRLHAKDVLKQFWDIDFATLYRDRVKSFWNNHNKTFRMLAKCTFLAQAMEDREGGRLSDDNFRTVVNAVAGNIRWPVTRQMLEEEVPPAKGMRISQLKVGDFIATDILCIVDADGRKMIYTPGETWGVHALQSDRHVHWWILSKIKTPAGRKRFMAHFQVADHDVMEDTSSRTASKKSWLDLSNPGINLAAALFREPHIENVGLNHVLDLLTTTWHTNDHKLVAVSADALKDDAFSYLASATHARMISDGEFMLHSNDDLSKKLWIGYLNAFNKVFAPMAAVGWPVALAVVGAGIATVGLEIDQAVNGKTKLDRKAAVTAAIFTAIDTIFNATFLAGEGALPEIAETSILIEEEEAMLFEAAKARTPLPPIEEIAPHQVLPKEPENFLDSFKTTINEPTLLEHEDPKLQEIIKTPSGKTYIMMRRGGVEAFYEVRYVEQMRGWVIIDPVNPFSFYRNVPVKLSEGLRWVPVARPGLRGGMKIFGEWPWGHTSNPLPEIATRPMPYDIGQSSIAELRSVAEASTDDFPLDIGPGNDGLYMNFRTLRRSLYDDAMAFYHQPKVPARPPVPPVKSSTTFADLSKRALKEAPGLVLGQGNASTGARSTLIKNFKVLNKQKVRTLYMDHLLSDFHQADLDLFHRIGEMSPTLEESLKAIDLQLGTDPTGPHSYIELVKAAQKNHIRVQAMDCMASRRFPNMERTSDISSRKLLNYFSDTAMRTDQATYGSNFWVALVDDERIATVNDVAGIGDLQGAVTLRVEDVPTGKTVGVSVDPGKPVLDLLDRPVGLIKGDLRLLVESKTPVVTFKTVEKALPRAGMCMIEDNATLIHRSGDGTLVRTPLQHDAGGYFLVRPRWRMVSGRHFSSLNELAEALADEGLTQIHARIDPLASESAAILPLPRAAGTKTVPNPDIELPDQPLISSPFEIPEQYRGRLKAAVNDPDGKMLGDQFGSLDEQSALPVFQDARRRLHQATKAFFDDLALLERPPTPAVGIGWDAESFINWWIETFDGLVIGESHGEIGSKQWLIENMELLARKGVKTLYMEHLLTDFHQASLDNFAKSGVMPRDLETYLKALDEGHKTDPARRFNFLEVVREATRYGIRVQAIDCMASYRLAGMQGLQKTTRQAMMNFFAKTVIEADQAARGPGKWVSLMGNSHANTFEGVPGVSELENALGLRIEDVPKGEVNGYEPDTGRTFVDIAGKPQGTVKSDLRLRMENPWPATTDEELEQLLSRPGMYTLKRELHGVSLVHRARDGKMLKTQINVESGRYYIERPSWPTLHEKRFDSMTDLLRALRERGLKEAV